MKVYDLTNYEDLYVISKNGCVYSIPQGKMLKPMTGNGGYQEVELYKNKKRKRFKIHRLMGINFIPNPQNFRFVKHVDGNKLNNDVSNLQWVNKKVNQK